MINKSLSIFFILLLFSCAKDGKNIYVEGRVVNPVTGEGIPNIKMELWKLTATVSGSGSADKASLRVARRHSQSARSGHPASDRRPRPGCGGAC